MEYPSTKRRKTSPTARIDIDASKSQRPASNRHGNYGSQSRASFMSPTKASLSRFNPNLLRRPGSAEPPKSSVGSRRDSRKAQTEEREVDSLVDKEKIRSSNHGLREVPKVNGHGHANDNLSSSIYEETPSKLPPRTTAARLAGATHEQHLQLRTPTHDRKQQATAGKDVDYEDEPSLPSTPSQLGLEPPPEKPRGLLFQSPGRRRVHQDRANTKSSPLKLNEWTEPRVLVSQDQLASILGPRHSFETSPIVEGVPQFSERNDLSLARTRLARRMRALQDDMTRLCIQSPSPKGEKEYNQRQTRMKRQLAQDARAFFRTAPSRGLEPRGTRHANLLQPEYSRVSTAPRSAFSRLVHLSRFSRQPHISMSGPAHSLSSASSQIETDSLELGTNITESEIVTAENDTLHVRQSLDVHIGRFGVFSKMQFLVDPLSQIVSGISTHQMVAWAAQDFALWLSHETSQRTLQTIGTVLRRYLDLVNLRTECWSRCKDTLPTIFTSDATDQRRIDLIKDPLKLRVWWRLIIDDDGKVQSDISLETELPTQWGNLDDSSYLSRLSEAFEGLIKRHGVSEAIKIMSRALFPP